MVIDDFRRETENGIYEVSARLTPETGGEEPFRVFFRFPEGYAPGGDLDVSPFLPGALPWCLRRGERLEIRGPVSQRLLDTVPELIGVYRSFYVQSIDDEIEVEAEAHVPSPGREITASMFTRGLDSWYGLLTGMEDPQLRPPLSHVVYLPTGPKGATQELKDAKAEGVKRAAARVGLEFIRLESNFKRHFGHPQFSMALALGFKTMLIASGDMRGGLRKKGLHPDIDPRYSTERTEIHHYGDASRIQKAARVVQSQDALDTLTICQHDWLEVDHNCGECEKCVRTMLELHALGALERCPVFAQPLKLENVAAIKDVSTSRQGWLEAHHALGTETEFDRRLRAASALVMLRSEVRFAAKQARQMANKAQLSDTLGDESLFSDTAEALLDVDRGVAQRMASLTGGRAPGAADDRASANGRGRGLLARLRSRAG